MESPKKDIILFLSHTDSKGIFKDNKPQDFVVKLNKDIFLNQDSTVELLEFRCRLSKTESKQLFYIMSDIVEDSYLLGKLNPVLRIIQYYGTKNQLNEVINPIAMKTVSGCFNQFRFYIKGKNFQELPDTLVEANITLRIKNGSYQ